MEKEDIWVSPNGIAYVSSDLIDLIRSSPISIESKHCDTTFSVSPFDVYVICPKCGIKMKRRYFTYSYELPNAFDAVFEWLLKPDAQELFRKRQKDLIKFAEEDKEE